MIHVNVSDTKKVSRINAVGIIGCRGYVKAVEDNGRSFAMILVEYPKERIDDLIESITYRP